MTSAAGTPQAAATFDMPALGRAGLKLGDVYSSTTGQFLGMSLFEGIASGDLMTIPAGRTDLKLSMSNTFDEKASSMDISASLSLEVLSGLVKVQGSGQYLTNSKSNVEQHCWAMTLFKRIEEKRLLFEEKRVIKKVTDTIIEGIKPYNPTHFISSIVYGGTLVINLVGRRVELEELESIKGELSVELQKLKGLVDLSGKGQVEISGNLKKMNDAFDLKVSETHFR